MLLKQTFLKWRKSFMNICEGVLFCWEKALKIIAYFCFKLIGSRGVIKTNVFEVDKVLQEYL